MLAPTSEALASVPRVDVEKRMQRVKAYVRHRLQAEVQAHPRGYQAEISRKLKISTAHTANLLSGKANVGEVVLRKFAGHWGMTFDELEAAALATPVVEPVDIERIVEVAVQLGAQGKLVSAVRVSEVRTELAAASGEITDEEIARRLLDVRVDEGSPAGRLRSPKKKTGTRS